MNDLLNMPYWEFQYKEMKLQEDNKRKVVSKKYDNKNSAFQPLINKRIEIPQK